MAIDDQENSQHDVVTNPPQQRQSNTHNGWLSTTVAGIVVGLQLSFFAISMANLIFSGPMSVGLSRGIGIALISVAILVTFVSLRSSVAGVVAHVQDGPSIIIAGAVASIAANLGPDGLPTVLVMIALITLLTGCSLIILGTFRLGGMIRYLPYPVIGGFLAGTGALLILGALNVMTDSSMTLVDVPVMMQSRNPTLWIPGLIFGFFLFLGLRFIRFALTLPIMLVIGFIVFYGVMALTQTSVTQAMESGLLLGDMGGRITWAPITPADLAEVNWSIIAEQAGAIIVVIIITIIAFLLNLSGIELVVRQDFQLNKELRSVGTAQILAAIFGGLPGYHSVSNTILAHRLGVRQRYAGLVMGAMPLFIFFLGSEFIAYVPRMLLGSIVLMLGINFVYDWLFDRRHSLSGIEYVTLILIATVILLQGFLLGLVVGIAITIVIFIYNYSRTNIFHQRLSGAEISSKVDRNMDVQTTLQSLGGRIYILQLQGYIFFGTANSIIDDIQTRVQVSDVPALEYLILDFRRVSGMDSSTLFTFSKLKYHAEHEGFRLLFSQLSEPMKTQFQKNGYFDDNSLMIFEDMDQALEWSENDLLLRHDVSQDPYLSPLQKTGLADTEIDILRSYMDFIHLEAGDILIQQGDNADALYFIESGRVSILLETGNGVRRRVQTAGSGTFVGEISFFTSARRTATVRADVPVSVYRLSREAMESLRQDHPMVALRFKDFMLLLLSYRLTVASREIVALSR